MKVLVLNGSPRPNGDTACVLEALKNRFPRGTEFDVLNAYEADIQPCNDCRYCWENEGCSIKDNMNNLWKDDCDVLVLASPLYMSFVTPPLFSIITRLNAIWSNSYFLKKPNTLKPKKGILILIGGGDGCPDPAINIAKTAFHFLNVHFDPDLDCIRSLNTNNIPVRDDPGLAGQIDTAIKHIMEKDMAENKIIAACGNDCSACPRYVARPYEKTDDELHHTAELWMKIGYRDHIVSNEEIACTGCKPENWCRYHAVKCCEEKGIITCAECDEYPCANMQDCFSVTESFEPKCRQVCSEQEYETLKKAFFEKEQNLKELQKDWFMNASSRED